MEVKLGCKLGEDGELVLYKLWFESDVAMMYAKIRYGRAVYEYDEDGHEDEKHIYVAYEAPGILESFEPRTISLGEGPDPFSCTGHEERALLTYGDEAQVAHETHVGDKAAMACILDGDKQDDGEEHHDED